MGAAKQLKISQQGWDGGSRTAFNAGQACLQCITLLAAAAARAGASAVALNKTHCHLHAAINSLC
jgi:hypothetical protein